MGMVAYSSALSPSIGDRKGENERGREALSRLGRASSRSGVPQITRGEIMIKGGRARSFKEVSSSVFEFYGELRLSARARARAPAVLALRVSNSFSPLSVAREGRNGAAEMQFCPRAFRAFPQLLPASHARGSSRMREAESADAATRIAIIRFIIRARDRFQFYFSTFIAMFSPRTWHRNRASTLKRKRFSQPVSEGGILARRDGESIIRHEC